jgi:hypothetical protein
MTTPRPIEAMPKPGFDQKGWRYEYHWRNGEYHLELTDPDDRHYWVGDRFPTMAAAYAWVKAFIRDQVPFTHIPDVLESCPRPDDTP